MLKKQGIVEGRLIFWRIVTGIRLCLQVGGAYNRHFTISSFIPIRLDKLMAGYR